MKENKKYKVLFILRMMGRGGAERQIVELCRGMDKERFTVTVVLFFDEPGGFTEELRATGVRVEVLSTKGEYKTAVFGELYRFFRAEEFDIVQTMLPIPNFVGGLVSRVVGQGKVIGSLRNVNPFSWWDPFCVMDFFAFHLFCSRIVTNSEAGKSSAVLDYKLPGSDVKVILNGKDLSMVSSHRSPDEVRGALGIPRGRKVALTVGRVCRQKGQKDLVEAARILVAEQKRDVCVLLVGKPEESAEGIEQQIVASSLGNHVRMLGVRQDIPDILRTADVFVLPSLWEGLPNVLLEAMAAGVPVVATDIAPNREVVTDGENGLLVPPENGPALAAAIGRIWDEPGLAGTLSANARRTVQERFSIGRLVREYQEFYEQCIHERHDR